MRIFAQKVLLASILFLIALPAWAGADEESVTRAAESFDEKSANNAVVNFYVVYLTKVNDSFEQRTGGVPPPKTWAIYFTNRLFTAYLKVLKTPDLDYDPILQSNNVPDGMTPIKTRVKGDTAWVSAKYAGYIKTTKPLELRLKKYDDRWLLDAIGPLNR